MTNTQSPAPGVAAEAYPEPVTNFEEGQWWVKELDAMVNGDSTPDQKRAVAVVHHLLLASRTPAPGMAGGVGAALRQIAYLNPKEESSIHGPRMRCQHCGHAWVIGKEKEHHDINCAYCIAHNALGAAPHPSPAPQAAGADDQRLNFLSQRGGMVITSDDENNRWHVEVLGGTDSEGEQIVTVYEGVTLRMAIDAACEGVMGAGRAGS